MAYRCFTRTWWRLNPACPKGLEPYPGREITKAHLTNFATTLLGDRIDEKRGGIVTDGAGQDMGYDLVYRLSSVLFGGQDKPGYVLKHCWI